MNSLTLHALQRREKICIKFNMKLKTIVLTQFFQETEKVMQGKKIGLQSNLDYPNLDFPYTSIIRTHRPGPMHKFMYS